MKAASSIACACLALTAAAGIAPAQQMISAKAGLINNTEGQVLVDGKPLAAKPSEFPQLKPNALLETKDGRVEILLSPGSYLRVAENSAIRMTSNRISDPKFEFVSGLVLVSCDELASGEAITVTTDGPTISLVKRGNYEIGGEPAVLKVFDGEARVDRGGQLQVVKKSMLLAFDDVSLPQKFDAKRGDTLYRWARRRSEYLSVANYSAARSMMNRSSGFVSNSWVWDPYYGMFTYIPFTGTCRSAFGYSYWSPQAVYYAVTQPRNSGISGSPAFSGGGGGGGYTGRAATSMGTSGVAASAGRTSAASGSTSAGTSSAAASAGRETGAAGGRGR